MYLGILTESIGKIDKTSRYKFCSTQHIHAVFSLGHVQLSPVHALARHAEAQQVADVLLALGLLGQLLALPLLARLLELAVPGAEGGGRHGEVVFVPCPALQRVLPPAPPLKVVRGELLLSLALANIALDIVMDLMIKTKLKLILVSS